MNSSNEVKGLYSALVQAVQELPLALMGTVPMNYRAVMVPDGKGLSDPRVLSSLRTRSCIPASVKILMSPVPKHK